MFIAEIRDKHELPMEKMIIDEPVVSEFAALSFAEAAAPEIEKSKKNISTATSRSL